MIGKQKRYLRAKAHSLKPLIQLGKYGINTAVAQQINQALLDHELLKVKVLTNSPATTKESAQQLAVSGTTIVQVIGRTIVLYRPHPDHPLITLPE